MADKQRILIIGLGTIARTHLAVLNDLEGVTVVGGVDPHDRLHPDFPVHKSLDAALQQTPEPDIVVVATPTDTHVDLAHELLVSTEALILSEKPLARFRQDTERLRRGHAARVLEDRLKVAHHFAFSPEVEWARRLVTRNPGWGRPTQVASVFNDAYSGLPDDQRRGYVSTWVDSGPNQLSLLHAFTGAVELVHHVGGMDRAVTRLTHDGGTTTLSSNWRAADTSKQTLISYADAGIEVRIDHTSMTGLLLHRGAVVAHAGYDGSLGRKEAHYTGLYRALLESPQDERLGFQLAESIARTLQAAGDFRPASGSAVSWESVTLD
jgi:predicted dehydrogenase